MKPIASIKVVICGHCYNSGIVTVVSTSHNEEKITDRILRMQSLSGQMYRHTGQHLQHRALKVFKSGGSASASL